MPGRHVAPKTEKLSARQREILYAVDDAENQTLVLPHFRLDAIRSARALEKKGYVTTRIIEGGSIEIIRKKN